MVYLKIQIVCMQEREELRALEREKRCQERENKEKSMCMEKKEGKNRKERKKINICMRE
jgi:hypothetical protein